MNKAVIGSFSDSMAASRAINDLKAQGFAGENVTHVLREQLPPGMSLPGPGLMPAMELLKGLIIGAIAGAILGFVAYWYMALNITWPGLALGSSVWSAVVTFAVIGAIAGILEGIAASLALGAAQRALARWRRPDALVAVHTDEMHAWKAADVMKGAGAWDVRRGASSLPDEFRTVEMVQPEAYGEAVKTERVEAPASEDAERSAKPVISE